MATVVELRDEQRKIKKLLTAQLVAARKVRKQIAGKQKDIAALESKLAAILGSLARAGKPASKPGRKPGRKPGPKPGPKPGRKPGRKPGPKPGTRRGGKRGVQKELIKKVLAEAGRPLSLAEILQGLVAKGLKSQAKDPAKSLSDKQTVVRAKPGYFTLKSA
jgi:hypothetical protein